MRALIFFFFELCLLRRAPQDLPASDLLFRLVLLVSLLVSILAGVASGQSLLTGGIRSLAQLLLLLAALTVGMGLMGRRVRFLQTATALLGSGTILGILGLIPIGMLPEDLSSEGAPLAGLIMLSLVIWSLVVNGHILRHALGLTLGQGVAVATLYELFSLVLLGGLYAT